MPCAVSACDAATAHEAQRIALRNSVLNAVLEQIAFSSSAADIHGGASALRLRAAPLIR
jgi:hypothetical protein